MSEICLEDMEWKCVHSLVTENDDLFQASCHVWIVNNAIVAFLAQVSNGA